MCNKVISKQIVIINDKLKIVNYKSNRVKQVKVILNY